MELGDHSSDRTERPRVDVALDKLNADFTELVDLIEAGGLDQLDAAERVALWQRLEAFRNRLPLIDHQMIADAEATDLAGSYGFVSMGRFLTRISQLSDGEAASQVRAAAALGPRTTERSWTTADSDGQLIVQVRSCSRGFALVVRLPGLSLARGKPGVQIPSPPPHPW